MKILIRKFSSSSSKYIDLLGHKCIIWTAILRLINKMFLQTKYHSKSNVQYFNTDIINFHFTFRDK